MRLTNHIICVVIIWQLSFAPLIPAQADEDGRQPQSQTWKVTIDGAVEEVTGTLMGLKDGSLEIKQTDGSNRQIPLENFTEANRKQALADRVGSGVVIIEPRNVFNQPVGVGSGFLIDSSGVILTNFHVIAGSGSIEVKFRDQESGTPAQLLAVDQQHDVAVLWVEKVPENTHTLELQFEDLPNPGADVWTIGHPQNLVNTVDWGSVNARRKTAEFPPNLRQHTSAPDGALWLQVDAVIAPGSSGGPLLNEKGQVIGINTLTLGENLGFAVHINRTQPTIESANVEHPLSLPLTPGEDKDPLAWMSREIAPLVKAYSEASAEFKKNAPRMEREQAITRYREMRNEYREKFIGLAQQDPKSWPALQALCYAAGMCDTEQPQQSKQICDLAYKNHIESPHIQAVMRLFRDHPTPGVRELCKMVAEESPHLEVQQNAKFNLALNTISWLENPDSIELKRIQQMRAELQNLVDEFNQRGAEIPEEEQLFNYSRLGQSLQAKLDSLSLGTPAIPTQGVDIDGQQFALSDYRGKVVLLDFFADWCPHCKRMFPSERQLVKEYEKRPFELLGINVDNQKILKQLVDEEQVTWRCWAEGPQSQICRQWNVDGFPTMFLLDHNGIIRWQVSGAAPAELIEKHVETLVKEAEAELKN